MVHNADNFIELTPAQHNRVTAFYNSKPGGKYGNLTVREWLTGKSFNEQYEFGLQVLKDLGITK